jgi:hypothetical protein
MKYKEFKKVLRSICIDNNSSFNDNLQSFLTNNPNIKILNIITHKPYHITIIYEVLVLVTLDNKI